MRGGRSGVRGAGGRRPAGPAGRGRVLAGAAAREPCIAVLVAATTVVYATFAVLKHDHYGSGFDLGIFTQAIWHYSQLQAPASSIRGFANLLGDHFHPIVILLAPLFWVWSDARALLVAQAALIAASVVPVYLFARPRLGRRPAHLLAFAYASFWGLGAGAGYEFHEVAFAPLLIAMTILLIDRRRWGGYWITVGLLLCVKEDLALFACCLGIYLLTLGEARRGLLTLAAGAVWYEVATQILIPHFAGGGAYGYWTYPAFGHGLGDAVLTVLRAPWTPFTVAFDHAEKAETLLYLLLPFLGLTLCSRLAILAVPLLAERFLSSNPQLWSPMFHYSLAIAPVLAMGAAAGLAGLLARAAAPARPRLALAGAAAMVLAGILVSGVVIPIPIAPWRQMVNPDFYRAPSFAGPVGRALNHVPPAASVIAPDFLVSHLAARPAVYELNPGVGDPPGGYLVTGLLAPVGFLGEHATYRAYQQDVERRLLLYQPTFYDDGWIVLRRRPGGVQSGTNGVLTPLARGAADRLVAIYTAWEAGFAAADVQFLGCAATRGRGDPAVRACLAAAAAGLLVAERRLDPALGAALAGVGGGCAQLGALARAGAAGVAADARALRAADPARLVGALDAFAVDVNDRDLPGRLTRFVMLCYPRPFAPGAIAPR